jgi:hypothetical protein
VGVFNKKELLAPDPSRYDIKGQGIFDLIAEALEGRGFRLRRGTAQLGRDKWGDGDYHLKFNADPIEPEHTGIGMFIDDVPYAKSAWNALSVEQRRAMCRDHVVSFQLTDDPLSEAIGPVTVNN